MLQFLGSHVLLCELGALFGAAAAAAELVELGQWLCWGTSFQESYQVLRYQVHMALSKAANFCCGAIKNSCTAAGVLRK